MSVNGENFVSSIVDIVCSCGFGSELGYSLGVIIYYFFL